MKRGTETLLSALPSKVATSCMSMCDPAVPAHVRDIDAESADNIFFMAEYARDIFEHLREREVQTKIPAGFMQDHQFINTRMRQRLVDWIADISNILQLFTETYILSIYIMDSYLARVKTIARNDFQLVGIACVLLASKFEEYSYVMIADFITLSANAFTPSQIKETECTIVNALGFRIIHPSPLDFFRRFSRAANNNDINHNCARYLVELATLDHRMMELLPSQLAAAAIYLSRRITNTVPCWDDTLAFYTGYSEEDVVAWARDLHILHQFVQTGQFAIKTKYSDPKFHAVATLPSCGSF